MIVLFDIHLGKIPLITVSMREGVRGGQVEDKLRAFWECFEDLR